MSDPHNPYNPYAAPGAAPPSFESPAGDRQPVPWEPVEIVKLAWSRFSRFWLVPALGFFLNFVITEALSQGPVIAYKAATRLSPNEVGDALVSMASVIFGLGLGSFLLVGIWRICLDVARNREPSLGTLFSGGDRFLAMLGVNILLYLAVGAGTILLIVPGIIAWLGLSFAPAFVVDARMSPVDALKASWRVTMGQKGNIFVLMFLMGLIAAAGLLACCVGYFPAAAVGFIAMAAAYTRMSGIDPALPGPGSY